MLKPLLLLAGLALAAGAPAQDKKVLPSELRRFAAPSGQYRLEVQGSPGWKQPQARARLVRAGGGTQPLWSQTLPQIYGPLLAFVSDGGNVVLVDEWMRTPGPHALVVLGKDGRTLARHGVEEIAALAGIAPEALVQQAKVGTWMSREARWAKDGKHIEAWAGSVRLVVDPQTGGLSRG